MVQYNNEIGVLPREKKGRNGDTFESRNGIGVLPGENDGDSAEKNREEEEALKKQTTKPTKKPKITDEQFQQHLNADPKLKAAYMEHQSLMERQRQATERVKNTGYLGTLWGGITGDSGVDQLAKINEETNAANTKFGNALDENAGYSQELKQQLRGYKIGANSDINAATAQAASDASERAENYAGATKAVRNTAIGAGLGVSAVLTGGATLGAASTILAGGGSATMAGGVVAGGALTGALGNTGYSLLRGETDVALDAGLNDRNLGQVQNDKNEQILKNSEQATRDGAKFGAVLPLAVTPVGRIALAGVGAYGGAKSVQSAGENFGQASTISGQEKVARASGDRAGADQLREQKNAHIAEGALSVGDTAAILGAGNLVTKKLRGTNSTQTPASDTPKNVHRNPDKPVVGTSLPEPRQMFKKITPAIPPDPKSPHETHKTEIFADGTKIIRGFVLPTRGPFQTSELKINPDGSYQYTSKQGGKGGEFKTRIVNKEPKIVPESGDKRPLSFYDERGYGPVGLEPKITRKEGYDPKNNLNFKHIYQVEGLRASKNLMSYSRPGEKPLLPQQELKGALAVRQKYRDAYKENANKWRKETQNIPEHFKAVTKPESDLPKEVAPHALKPESLPKTQVEGMKIGERTEKSGGPNPKNTQDALATTQDAFPRELNSQPKNGGNNIRKNPNKPVKGEDLPEPRQMVKKVAPSESPKLQSTPDIHTVTMYQTLGRPETRADARGIASHIRQIRTEHDEVNHKNLGQTQIDSHKTYDLKGNTARKVVTYGPDDITSLPTQVSKARRKRDARGNLIQGENQTHLSNGARRIVKTTPGGILSTYVSAGGDVRQRFWQKKKKDGGTTSPETSQLPEHLKTVTKPESVLSKEQVPLPKKLLSDEEIGDIQRDDRDVGVSQ